MTPRGVEERARVPRSKVGRTMLGQGVGPAEPAAALEDAITDQ